MTPSKKPRLGAFWDDFLRTLPEDANTSVAYQAWGFGDSPEMADKLGALVIQGIKTATASLVWAYEPEGEALPEVGDFSMILDGQGEPMCIIQITSVSIHPFNDVDEEQAYLEGEGDRSLAFWREVHWRFFSRECAQIGRIPDETMPVVCERFKLVYP